MKLSIRLLRLLVLLSCGGANEMSAAEVANTNSFRVIVKPSKTEVHVNELFPVALRVENVTATNRVVRVMNCSWDQHWTTSNTNITWLDWNCSKNFAVTVEIAPGGAYTNRMEMLVTAPSASGNLSFRMGFTPIDSPSTLWSDEVVIDVMPGKDGKSARSPSRNAADIFSIDVAAADPPHLLLKLTESWMDNARRQRHGVSFLEMNGTNMCGVWLHLPGGKDKRTFEATMEEVLEKEGTRDTNGFLRRKATTETIFFVPAASIQSILRFAYPNFYLGTDFSGWKLVSPTRTEIEKSETLQGLFETRNRTKAEFAEKSDERLSGEQVDAIWKGVWESGDPNIKEPKIEKLSESDVVRRMTGTWTVMFGVIPDKLMISLSTNRLVEVSGRKDGAAWKKSGQWRVISDKLVLFLKEDKLPSFIFMTEQRPHIFDPWAKTMRSELKQEK